MKKWNQFLVENDLQVILADVQNPHSQNIIKTVLGEHPEWLQGILNFKNTNPEKYAKSIGNFKHNTPNAKMIEKLASGQSLGYYDFM